MDRAADPIMELALDVQAPRTAGATARVIDCGRGRLAALPPHCTLEVVEHPMAEPVPGGMYYGLGLLDWQGRRIPLIDLGVLLCAYRKVATSHAPRYALVVARAGAPGQAQQFGAIALEQLPATVTVHDADCCALPTDSDLWPWIAPSCFLHGGQRVPVLDTARLFGACHG